MNILFSCVGRRSYMVDYFKKALDGNGLIVGTNSEPLSSGMAECDISYIVPEVDSAEYIPMLLKIAKKHKISMIISLFDIDLPYLAKAKDQFKKESIDIIVSSEKVIDIANDKLYTYKFLKENSFKTPLTLINLSEAINHINNRKIFFPLFIKPRFGMGSIGVHKAENIKELIFFYQYVQKQISITYLKKFKNYAIDELVLIQEAITGKEFGIDIFNDLNGKFLININKEKITMRSGETDIAVVVDNFQLDQLSIKLSHELKHIGNLDADILYDGKNYYILEFNARFGGGFPFSYIAGANIPKILIDLIENKKIVLPKIKYGTTGLKKIQPILFKSKKIRY